MSKHERRYDSEEFARRGREIYTRDIKPTLRSDDDGKFVAIDIETGMYEIDDDEKVATDRLYARRADAQPWVERIGYRAAVSFGGGWKHLREDWKPSPEPAPEVRET